MRERRGDTSPALDALTRCLADTPCDEVRPTTYRRQSRPRWIRQEAAGRSDSQSCRDKGSPGLFGDSLVAIVEATDRSVCHLGNRICVSNGFMSAGSA